MGYSQEQINAAYSDLIAQGYTANEANAFLNGILVAEQAAPATDPRYEEMYAQWQQQQQLTAYDSAIEQIVAANPDINPNRLHAFVAAAEGNWDKAVEMERADRAQILQDHGLQPIPEPDVPTDAYAARRAEGMSPEDALHAAVDDATAWAKYQRARGGR
jgi:hypothetical protein